MPSVPRIDLVGRQFGQLLVLSEVPRAIRSHGNPRIFLCRCDCGQTTVVRYGNLTSGMTRSCGCTHWKKVTHHGHAAAEIQTPEYRAWADMINRCTNPNLRNYPNYGGRGIQVCDAWRHSFEAFFAAVGPRPSAQHSLDRIDNEGHYEPGNVRWATKTEQCRNRRACVFLEYGGKRLTLTEWALELGISREATNARRRNGWTTEQIIEGRSPSGRKLPGRPKRS